MPTRVVIPSDETAPLSIASTMSSIPPAISKSVTRLAPSPTGALHLGNARTFIVNWAMARTRGWQVRLRMEDLDGPRIKPGSAERTIELLSWMGLDWDGDTIVQSTDLSPYRDAMRELCAAGDVFACNLSRGEIQAASSAPQQGASEKAYPRSLRPANAGDPVDFVEEAHNYRFLVEDPSTTIEDLVAGSRTFGLPRETGDFVAWTRRGTPAYQLSVVVDDIRQGVTDVVRGDDLLESAARQTLLYRAFDRPCPRWWHLPLVLGPDGHRLAKRHGDTRVETYRAEGMTVERLIGLMANWCGLRPSLEEMTMEQFLHDFDLDLMSREPITFTEQEHAWLAS